MDMPGHARFICSAEYATCPMLITCTQSSLLCNPAQCSPYAFRIWQAMLLKPHWGASGVPCSATAAHSALDLYLADMRTSEHNHNPAHASCVSAGAHVHVTRAHGWQHWQKGSAADPKSMPVEFVAKTRTSFGYYTGER
jgi:hypothetical protein